MLLSATPTRKAHAVLVLLVFSALALVVLPDLALPAHALSPSVIQSKGGTTASTVFTSSVTSGDTLFASVFSSSASTTVSDSRCASWTDAASATDGSGNYIYVFYCRASSSGSDTVTAATGTPTVLVIAEVSNLGPQDGSGVGGHANSASGSTSSLSFTAGDFLFSGIVTTGGAPAITAGASFADIASGEGASEDSAQYQAGATSPTTFPFTLSSITWDEAGAAFLPMLVQPVKVTMSNSAFSSAVTVTGSTCQLNATSFNSDGSTHHFAMVEGCSYTLSFSNSGTTRDGFSVSSAFDATSSTETASATLLSLTAYEQVQESFSYSISGGGAGYSAPVLTGTYLGTASSTIATLTGTSTASWLDYNTAWSTPATLTGSGSTYRWDSEGADSGTSSAGGTAPVTYTYQYAESDLTTSGCNGQSTGPASETGDGWWNAGDTVSVTCNGIWSRSGGTGDRAISYNWNGGTNTAVLTVNRFTATIAASTSETLNVNPTTQYFVTLDSGATAALSSCNPTIPGDGCWYDSGTTASITLNGVFNRGSGSGGRLEDWQIDSGSVNGLTTTLPTTIQIPVISAPHAIYTTTVTQYQVVPSAGLTLSHPTIANDTGWYDANAQVTITGEGGAATYVVSSPIWANQVSSYGVQLITNAQAGSINFGSLDLVYTCASCWTRLFVPTASDLSVQTVTQGGVSLSYSTQGFITSFSATGGSSAWEVYFGQAASDGGDTTTTTTHTTTSSTSSAAAAGLFDNSATTSYIEIILIVAVAVIALAVVLTKDQGARNIVVKIRNKVG